MTPMISHEVNIEGAQHLVGIFGCTLATGAQATRLLQQSQQIEAEFDVTLQLMKASLIAGSNHLLFASIHALRAFQQGTNRADTLGMEILRFAAAQRQITRALSLMGLQETTQEIGGVILGTQQESLQSAYSQFLATSGGRDAISVLEISAAKKAKTIQKAFDISPSEITATVTSRKPRDQWLAITKLVYERCALIAITK